MDFSFSHDYRQLQYQIGSEGFGKQIFEIVEIVMHVHFGWVEVNADD